MNGFNRVNGVTVQAGSKTPDLLVNYCDYQNCQMQKRFNSGDGLFDKQNKQNYSFHRALDKETCKIDNIILW